MQVAAPGSERALANARLANEVTELEREVASKVGEVREQESVLRGHYMVLRMVGINALFADDEDGIPSPRTH